MGPTLSIKAAGDIRALAGDLNLWHADRRSLDVALPQLDGEANRQLHRRIALHYATCGCHQGRLAGVAILAVYVLLIVSGVLSWRALGIWKAIGLYFLLSFCGLLLSKIVILERSRRALRRMASEIEQQQES
ncbi:MAG TPA: hypothetical protein VF405_14140 [Gammaproteobacteria bacterium]